MAMAVAVRRDMVNYLAAFTATVTPFLLFAARRNKNPALAAPLLPLAFLLNYQVAALNQTEFLLPLIWRFFFGVLSLPFVRRIWHMEAKPPSSIVRPRC